jgi:hypothetical protein
VRLDLRHARVVTRDSIAPMLERALSDGSTLHGWAGRQPGARALQGRGVTWAVDLPGVGDRVVVRHNRHGGAFARFTGDLFLRPTRAPLELAISLELVRRDVPTPGLLAYAVYGVGIGPLARSDVATREIADARDLGDWLTDGVANATERREALDATARLIAALFRAGVRHHDLNVKNVLLARSEDGGERLDAWLLDVDRVTFSTPRDSRTLSKNVARLLRSIEKWRVERDARITDDDVALLIRRVDDLHA